MGELEGVVADAVGGEEIDQEDGRLEAEEVLGVHGEGEEEGGEEGMVLGMRRRGGKNVGKEGKREGEQTDQIAVVLEVDVVDDEEAGSENAENEREEREGGGFGLGGDVEEVEDGNDKYEVRHLHRETLEKNSVHTGVIEIVNLRIINSRWAQRVAFPYRRRKRIGRGDTQTRRRRADSPTSTRMCARNEQDNTEGPRNTTGKWEECA